MRKLASYSLFGDRPLYWNSLRGLVWAHHNLFPGWELRIYHDSSLEKEQGKLAHAYAASNLVNLVFAEENKQPCRSMLWRLKPLWDDDVEWVLARDIDSLPTGKDRRITEVFLASGAAVHCFNDHPQHTAVMMGGMVSFNAPEFRKITGLESWEEMISLCPYLGNATGGADQMLMHDHLWPRVKSRVCEHRFCGMCADVEAQVSYTKVGDPPIADVPAKILDESDSLIPFMGCPGYDVSAVVEYFKRNGNSETTTLILKAEHDADIR